MHNSCPQKNTLTSLYTKPLHQRMSGWIGHIKRILSCCYLLLTCTAECLCLAGQDVIIGSTSLDTPHEVRCGRRTRRKKCES
jgi:hypothetical protein